MEAVRALPPAAQIQAVRNIAEAGNAVDRAGNAVRNWARNNPNTSEVAKAAANVGGTAFGAAKSISHVRSHYEFGGIGGNAVTRRQMGAVSVPNKRAPEYQGGNISESGFANAAERWLGKGCSSLPNGRYVSKDGMRQIRYGNHEVKSSKHHGHFEAYDKPGGRIIKNAAVIITPDNKRIHR